MKYALRIALLLLVVVGISWEVMTDKCEDVTVPFCKGIPYKKTKFPNKMNHESQEEAGMEVKQYWPLINLNCSSDLKFFLCSMYTPICIEDYHKSLPVCRSICERARAGCEPIMQQYNFSWPERLSCDHFPRAGDPDHLCMQPSTRRAIKIKVKQ